MESGFWLNCPWAHSMDAFSGDGCCAFGLRRCVGHHDREGSMGTKVISCDGRTTIVKFYVGVELCQATLFEGVMVDTPMPC